MVRIPREQRRRDAGTARDSTNHATRGFVAYDPEGYYLEFETFLEHPENTRLLRALAKIEQ